MERAAQLATAVVAVSTAINVVYTISLAGQHVTSVQQWQR
jgi:hypothetical protein